MNFPSHFHLCICLKIKMVSILTCLISISFYLCLAAECFSIISSERKPPLTDLIPLTVLLSYLHTENVVLRFIHSGRFVFAPCHVINNRSKVGGSIELNRLKALMVSFKNPLHTIAVWVLNVAILKETKQVHYFKKKKNIYIHILYMSYTQILSELKSTI